ncbi:MAG TPA: hypothetical protein PKK43_02860 [Spirochaetota bacterium]|nr:hypothetical protein [Spirochaetota bacterium]
MTLFFKSIGESHLGYSALFACMAIGFILLWTIDRDDTGPGYWSISLILNSIGFFLWSGVVPVTPWKYYLAGELFHISGFILFVCGAYRFAGNKYKAWNFLLLIGWLIIWTVSLLMRNHNPFIAAIVLKGLRALLFIITGTILLRNMPESRHRGRKLAGFSLILWGAYVIIFAFINAKTMANLAYGFLIGFQVLALFGMIAMIVERISVRAEESEIRAKHLEGLLPICSYCKKIRDGENTWHSVEVYIREHSEAVFSHGICPDCLKKHYPNIKSRK